MKPVRDAYHAGLSRAVVVTAAVELLQVSGMGGFSVRRLAAELGVDTMALYKHVKNKDDLIGAAVAHVFADARPAEAGEWWERTAAMLREHRRVIRQHPWVLAVMLDDDLQSVEPWSGVDETLVLLQKHLGPSGAARWMRLLAAFTNGFLLTETELVNGPDEQQIASAFPRVDAALSKNARRGDQDFEIGLDLVITGMRNAAAARTR